VTKYNILTNGKGVFQRAFVYLPDDPNHGVPVDDRYFTQMFRDGGETVILFEYDDQSGRLEWWPAMGPAPHWSVQHVQFRMACDVMTPQTFQDFLEWCRENYG
jgi:hypothetical protein